MKQKKYISFILFFCLSAVLNPFVAFNQEFPFENVELITDRNVYICGESIHFSGIVSIDEEKEILSEVVYVELITSLGQKLKQAKIKIENDVFEGEILIPNNAVSSYYFIRAYTKWMRNGSPYQYAYVRLKLINPYSPEVLEIPDSLVLSESENLSIENNINTSFFSLKDEYQKGEIIRVENESNSPLSYRLASLSIIPSETISPFEYMHSLKNYDSIVYIPETRGITLSGKVLKKETKKPLPYSKTSIHIENENDFIEVMADKEGQFYFSLPNRYGSSEVLIIPSSQKGKGLEVLVDQDYCNKEVQLKSPEFTVSEDERAQLIQMTQALQISQLIKVKGDVLVHDSVEHPFYGHAFKTLDFDSFIELDSMSQYFTDLPSYVRVKKQKGERSLSVVNPEYELSYEPLILIDWVAVDDPEKILKLDPRRIKKVEVIVESYIHGSIIYGGIIAIFSRKNDFAGYDFPQSAMYINFDFFAEATDPAYMQSKQKVELQNTKTWIPYLEPEFIKEGIELQAPAIPGSYVLLIQSINEDGEKVNYQKTFTVK